LVDFRSHVSQYSSPIAATPKPVRLGSRPT
jgi:hypothetical protein